MKSVVIKNGMFSAGLLLITNILYAIWIFQKGSENYELGELIGYAAIILSLSFVFLGVRNYREKHIDVSFGKSLLTGLLITLFPAVIFGLYNVVYVELIDPGFMDSYYQHQIAQMHATLPEAEFNSQKAAMEANKALFMNPMIQFLVMFMTVFLIGFIITIISAILPVKKIKAV